MSAAQLQAILVEQFAIFAERDENDPIEQFLGDSDRRIQRLAH